MMTEALLRELEKESEITRRVLERVPEDKLGWQPHARSMTLGKLAVHIATQTGSLIGMMRAENYEIPADFKLPDVASRAELREMFEASLKDARRVLERWDDAALEKTWTVTRAGKTLISIPRSAGIRFIVFNHLCHHRGQLSVYLRLLDVPVPSIYGPSADENPWA